MRKVFSFRETEPLWRRSLHKGFRYFVSQDTDCIHLSPSVKCIWNAITNWPRDFVQWTTCLYAKEPWKKSQSPKRSIEKYLNLLRPGCISTQKYDIAICWFCLPFGFQFENQCHKKKRNVFVSCRFSVMQELTQLTCSKTTSQ